MRPRLKTTPRRAPTRYDVARPYTTPREKPAPEVPMSWREILEAGFWLALLVAITSFLAVGLAGMFPHHAAG